MVLPGQFLERPALIKVRNFYLEGLFQKGLSPDAVPALIAPAHPYFGGSMTSPPVMEIAYSLFRAGCPTLRFNFRGVGGSRGRATADPEKSGEDFHKAAVHLMECSQGRAYIAAGYSFGASIAYRCAVSPLDPPSAGARLRGKGAQPILRLILVAPRLREMDVFSLPRPERPVLVIIGDRDPSCPKEEAKKLLELLGNRGRLCIVSEADHSFTNGLGEIGALIVEFTKTQDLR